MDDAVPRRRPRNREVDAYIAFAVVASVVFTVYQFCNTDGGLYPGTAAHTVLASLDAAVPFFFVLIGCRAYRPIVVSYLGGRPLTPSRRFLARQAIAIIPAYYAVITVVWFCRQQSLPGDWRDLLEHLTFTQVFDGKRIFYTDGPTWAVSVTTFFLILLTIVVIGLRRISVPSTRKRRLLLLVVPPATLTAISLTWKAWSLIGADRSTGGSSTTWYGPLANLDNFALGMAAALILAAFENIQIKLRYRLILRVGALVLVVAAIAIRNDDRWLAAYFATICAVAFTLVLIAAELAVGSSESQRLDPGGTSLGRRVLRGLVAIAYGTYLWREPVLLTLHGWDGLVVQRPGAFIRDTVVVLAVSILIAAISYPAIEQPALQLYRLATRRGPHPNPPATTPSPSASVHPLRPAR